MSMRVDNYIYIYVHAYLAAGIETSILLLLAPALVSRLTVDLSILEITSARHYVP